MAKILVISSFLAHGAIGLRAVIPALEALGHTVIAAPSIILSNHPRHPHVARLDVPPPSITALLAALDGNGWLGDIGAILTGYLPSGAHVAAARSAVDLVRKRSYGAVYVCDPILGDDPGGLYIEAEAAAAIRDHLLPLADVATPNSFELAWLTGKTVATPADAASAARALGPALVAATSIPETDDRLATLFVAGDAIHTASIARQPQVPHGIGDLFAALLTGLLVRGATRRDAFQAAHRLVGEVVALSAGQADLDLSPLTGLASVP
jgi:pyridoxine kinase